MLIILTEFIRSLKERGELDILLPDLLSVMGIFPVSKTQRGTRQFGSDLQACGIDPVDSVKKLFLFVIKRGDLGRVEWNKDAQSIRPSLDEIFDVYLKSHVSAEHQSLKKVVVLVTSGEMKEEMEANWSGYTKDRADKAEFRFWGMQQLASLILQYLLNENIFLAEDRSDLRKALSLAGEVDYAMADLYRLFRRQLELTEGGTYESARGLSLQRSFLLVDITAKLFAKWSLAQNNSKSALIALERALLWSWHRAKDNLKPTGEAVKPEQSFDSIWNSYLTSGADFVGLMSPYYSVKNGLSIGTIDSGLHSLILFEHIGLLACLGLALLAGQGQSTALTTTEVVDSLVALIRNNSSSGSPRLDEHVIEINLALLLLMRSGKGKEAEAWLESLINRTVYSYSMAGYFPAHSIDEIVNGDYDLDTDMEGFRYSSWMLPTLADWSIFLGRKDLYEVLASGYGKFPWVCPQLWYPTTDVFEYLYFRGATSVNGIADAPIQLYKERDTYERRIQSVLSNATLDCSQSSPSVRSGREVLDFIASRHFRTPVSPFVLYHEFQAN